MTNEQRKTLQNVVDELVGKPNPTHTVTQHNIAALIREAITLYQIRVDAKLAQKEN